MIDLGDISCTPTLSRNIEVSVSSATLLGRNGIIVLGAPSSSRISFAVPISLNDVEGLGISR